MDESICLNLSNLPFCTQAQEIMKYFFEDLLTCWISLSQVKSIIYVISCCPFKTQIIIVCCYIPLKSSDSFMKCQLSVFEFVDSILVKIINNFLADILMCLNFLSQEMVIKSSCCCKKLLQVQNMDNKCLQSFNV